MIAPRLLLSLIPVACMIVPIGMIMALARGLRNEKN
jgi:hypothetical protein